MKHEWEEEHKTMLPDVFYGKWSQQIQRGLQEGTIRDEATFPTQLLEQFQRLPPPFDQDAGLNQTRSTINEGVGNELARRNVVDSTKKLVLERREDVLLKKIPIWISCWALFFSIVIPLYLQQCKSTTLEDKIFALRNDLDRLANQKENESQISKQKLTTRKDQ